MFTQKRTLGCDDNQVRWFEHFILVLGYLGLLFTTVFLDWFSTQSMFVIILGYVESAVIFVVTFDFVRRRIQKDKEISKHSHPSVQSRSRNQQGRENHHPKTVRVVSRVRD